MNVRRVPGRLWVIGLFLVAIGCGGSGDETSNSNANDIVTAVDTDNTPPDSTVSSVDTAAAQDTTVSVPEPTPLADAMHGGSNLRWDLKQALYVGADGAELDITDACALDDYYVFRNDGTYDKGIGTKCRETELAVDNGSWSVDEANANLTMSEFGPEIPFGIDSLLDDTLWLVLDLSLLPPLSPGLEQEGLVRTRFERVQ